MYIYIYIYIYIYVIMLFSYEPATTTQNSPPIFSWNQTCTDEHMRRRVGTTQTYATPRYLPYYMLLQYGL